MANVVFGPYLTKRLKFHQHDSSNGGKGGAKPNDYNQMKNWYESVKKCNLNGVILHNECSPEFIKKFSTEKISFFNWEKKHRPSYNDERFYAYHEYLVCHPKVERVFFTDLFDVRFCANPFKLMEKNPEHDLFFGEELMSKSSSRWMVRKCREMKLQLITGGYHPGQVIYNAGIIGGKRKHILNLLIDMKSIFDKIHPRYNANMPVFNFAASRTPSKIFSGPPLHNKFRSNKVPEGTYIKHK